MSTSTTRLVGFVGRRWAVTLAGVIALSLVSGTALAQRGGGPQLAPEKREAAWTLEAKGVAKSLSVSDENTGKLVKAYIESRKSQQDAVSKITATGPDRFAEMQKINDAEREKLKKALADILKDQTDKALASLGSFNGRWDMMVDTLADFKLAADKQDKALGLVTAYVAESTAALAKAGSDRRAAMPAIQEAKTKLDGEITKLVSAEQATKWTEATSFGRGGGGGGGRRGGDAGATPAPAAPATPAAPAAPAAK